MNTAEPILEAVADSFLARYRAGERPSVEAYAEQHPEIADEIAELLASVELMEQLSASESEIRELASMKRNQAPKIIERLGEFDIVRQIGRGGMGVVYEATDRSLGRRVALKVVHSSALASQNHIDRFRRESQLAAQLHHTNIVSVFGVGEENGTYFYAMQFVDGVTVGNILEGLRCLSHDEDHNDASQLECCSRDMNAAAALKSGRFAQERKTHADVTRYSSASVSNSTWDARLDATLDPTNESSDTDRGFRSHESWDRAAELQARLQPQPKAGESSYAGIRSGSLTKSEQLGMPYWRSVARIGIQVADALHYAHANGILHRDIKPTNLLFDSHGTIWVADFGLAKFADHDDLTMTGNVVGTLRYMAPEQLAGKADVRTDIYALGLTLYELLTLKTACDAESYKQIFAQKQNQSFAAPRKVDSTIPRDLETIVQKMLAHEPAKRYGSAGEVSNDLQRFLADRPIQARRVTPVEQFWRWCRRNRVIATLAAVSAALLLLLPMVLGWAFVRETAQRQQTERTLGVALEGFDELYRSFLDEEQFSSTALAREELGKDFDNLAPATLTKDAARILERMLVFYDRLAQENQTSSDQQLLMEAAKARRRVGDLYQRLGQFSKAHDAYHDAISRYQPLAKRDPARHAIEVSRIHNAIGAMHLQRQNHRLAAKSHTLALATLQAIPSQEADNVKFEIARTNYLLGKQRDQVGRRPHREPSPFNVAGHEAAPLTGRVSRIDHVNTAIRQLEELRTSDANSTDYRFLLALCLREKSEKGVFHENADSPRGRAAVLLRALANEFPATPRYRFELSETYRVVGHHRLFADDPDRAIEQLLVARELSEQLVAEQGQVASYRIQLAHIYAHLGINYGNQRRICQAEEYSRMALESHRHVVREFPGLASLSERLSAGTRKRIATWLLQQFRWEETIELLRPLADDLNSRLETADLTESTQHELRRGLAESAHLLVEAYDSLDNDEGLNEVVQWIHAHGRPRGAGSPQGPGFPQKPFDPLLHALDVDHDRSISAQELAAAPAALRSLDQNQDDTLSAEEFAGPIPGPPPDHYGPPPDRAGPALEPPRVRSAADFVETLLTYDINSDGELTREELPQRMRQEWFERADIDSDSSVVEEELRSLYKRYRA